MYRREEKQGRSSHVSEGGVPRPEYPRPQFVRQRWLNLNGEWEFSFDDADQGLRHNWHDGRSLGGRIIVPFPYQCELSGINDKSVHEVVWYARSFEVPDEWREQDLLLHFGAVDYSATVWINGHEVGHNSGGHVPFSFEIGPYLQSGTNRLTLRVEDRQDTDQPRGKQSASGKPVRIYYYCTTGIWQTVWLEPVSPIRIEELDISTSASDESIELVVRLHAPFAHRRLEIDVLESPDSENPVTHETVNTRGASGRSLLKIVGAKLWSAQSPHLYGLRIRLYQGDQLLDDIKSYAGIRTFDLRDGRFFLNGRSTYLSMVLDQGYWPESYMAAPSDDALRQDVEWVKRFGFNGVRKHQKIEDPRWLYWCDRLGLLVWGEMPNARSWSIRAEERLLAEWMRAVRRDYNHPSIITWVILNESMGFPELRHHHPGQYAFIERAVRLTRRLDPDRPVIDNDGWEHTDLTDICAIHDYSQPSEKLVARYDETLRGGPPPPKGWHKDKPLFLCNSRYRGQPIVLSEVGGFLLVPEGAAGQRLDRLYDFYGSFSSPEELLEKYTDLMKGLAALTFLAGFCYTQLTDIEHEINGLLTYDRKPKVPPELIAEIHRVMLEV